MFLQVYDKGDPRARTKREKCSNTMAGGLRRIESTDVDTGKIGLRRL